MERDPGAWKNQNKSNVGICLLVWKMWLARTTLINYKSEGRDTIKRSRLRNFNYTFIILEVMYWIRSFLGCNDGLEWWSLVHERRGWFGNQSTHKDPTGNSDWSSQTNPARLLKTKSHRVNDPCQDRHVLLNLKGQNHIITLWIEKQNLTVV